MDMKKILENLESVENGNGVSKPADAGSMKAILESINDIEEGGYPMPPSMPPQSDKVRMNVSLNAEGRDGIEDLLDLMRNAGLRDAGAVDADMMPMVKQDPCPVCGKVHLSAGSSCMGEDDVEEEWDNSPEDEYADHEYMTKDLSGGLNREKKAYAASQRGDNAMAVETVKERLLKALSEKQNGICSDCGNPSWRTLPEEKQKGVDGKVCWKGYKRMGTKKKGGKTVDNCVKMSAAEKNK